MGGCWAVVFQFHKGTIKTAFNQKPTRYSSDFNSIKVRLKLLPQARVYKMFLDFNSIKVRLKQN